MRTKRLVLRKLTDVDTTRSFLNVLRSFPKGKNNLLQRRVDIFKNLTFVHSWALSKGSIQKAGVLYIKIFACNFRLHSKVCIFIEFLPLLPRNVTKSHNTHVRFVEDYLIYDTMCRHDARWHRWPIQSWRFFAA